MKKILILIPFIVAALAIYQFFPSSKQEVTPVSNEVLGVSQPVEIKSMNLSFEGASYSVVWTPPLYGKTITLIENFTQKETALSVFKDNNCKILVNGGFYTPEDKPTGLFTTNDVESFPFIRNKLLNGVFSINDFGVPRITRSVPADHIRVGLQTGPLLIENSWEQALTLSSDKPARRMALATLGSNEVVFIAIYKKDNPFAGPYLAQLPHLLTQFSNETGLMIADAVNLDGGSASAMYIQTDTNDYWQLSEATPVGSFFCVQDR